MTGLPHDLANGNSIFRQRPDRLVRLLPAQISVVLQLFRISQKLGVNDIAADRLPDLAHRPADSIEKGPAGILHKMLTVGDLLCIRQGLRDGLTIAATPVASDDRYRRMLGKP
ncbi:hypothetical protein SIAM614_28811 [Stappia aggregata IAM 12614]|uniref:Uncharacterized protein n=1 Tax=Roseibium aggregatum (strain ATCC 25650 / DSM 13394 / JCM 20685 / NBRC 16684 / NCIMB 2208 / IAM 12614 / B1) TaxID=384765 RepID=A0P4C4_ROSAI|nr:hypothetical protein SIAM614_28811 [Stappia aggregata IAM 12614] [Roseibium aggregatum IAM 12614]